MVESVLTLERKILVLILAGALRQERIAFIRLTFRDSKVHIIVA